MTYFVHRNLVFFGSILRFRPFINLSLHRKSINVHFALESLICVLVCIKWCKKTNWMHKLHERRHKAKKTKLTLFSRRELASKKRARPTRGRELGTRRIQQNPVTKLFHGHPMKVWEFDFVGASSWSPGKTRYFH